MVEKLIESLLGGLVAGVWCYLYLYAIRPGEAMEIIGAFINKLPGYFGKPLGTCPLCFSFWVGIIASLMCGLNPIVFAAGCVVGCMLCFKAE